MLVNHHQTEFDHWANFTGNGNGNGDGKADGDGNGNGDGDGDEKADGDGDGDGIVLLYLKSHALSGVVRRSCPLMTRL